MKQTDEKAHELAVESHLRGLCRTDSPGYPGLCRVKAHNQPAQPQTKAVLTSSSFDFYGLRIVTFASDSYSVVRGKPRNWCKLSPVNDK